MCGHGQMSLGTFAPIVGQLPAGSSVFLVPASLSEFLPGPRVGVCSCWCVVFEMFLGGCFFIWVLLSDLCSSGIISCCSGVLWLSSKETWNWTTSEGFMRSLESWSQGWAFRGHGWRVKIASGPSCVRFPLPRRGAADSAVDRGQQTGEMAPLGCSASHPFVLWEKY